MSIRGKEGVIAPVEWLTSRQLEIIRLIDQGYTYDEMGEKLGISPRTVKSYTEIIKLKLGVTKKRYIPRVLKEMGMDLYDK